MLKNHTAHLIWRDIKNLFNAPLPNLFFQTNYVACKVQGINSTLVTIGEFYYNCKQRCLSKIFLEACVHYLILTSNVNYVRQMFLELTEELAKVYPS